jgi:hypothetical protein
LASFNAKVLSSAVLRALTVVTVASKRRWYLQDRWQSSSSGQ